MKKKILLLFAILATAISASAGVGDTFEAVTDGVTIYYKILSEDDKTCEVTYKNKFSADYTATIVNIPSKVTNSTTEYTVTSIGELAFNKCSSLTSVEIPNSVTTIGYAAFAGCTNLTSVTIPNSVTSIGVGAFYKCSSLTSVEIPNSVTSIGNYAFQDCTSLTSVVIPNSVTSIGEKAFFSCSSLTSVTIPNSVTTIGYAAFSDTALSNDGTKWENDVLYIGNHLIGARGISGTYTIKEGTLTIADNAFWGCSSLTSVVIPNSVTTIGKLAFFECSNLESVEIGNSVTEIGNQAFYGCSSLTSVVIPNSVTTIGYNTFYECSNLTSVEIGNSVTEIGDQAFYGCSGLASVDIGNSVTEIGESAFESCTGLTSVTIPNSVTTIGYYAFYGCSGLASVEIGNSVTEIGAWAFSGCSSLESFTGRYASVDHRCLILDGVLNSFAPAGLTSYDIPNSVTSIGTAAFSGCSSLTSVDIGNSVTSIGEDAFYYCESLTSVVIGNSVTSIGYAAFYYCESLTSVVIGNSVTEIGTSAFESCTGLTSVVIPNSVTEIRYSAFENCTSLKTITSLRETAPNLGNNVFSNIASSYVIKVPGIAIGSYFRGWFDYRYKLQAISLALTDAAGYTCYFSFESGTTTYTRDFKEGVWQALFLPFAMNYSDWSDKGIVAELTGVNGDVLEWTTIESGDIEAGKPYIFKPKEAGSVTFSVSDATLKACSDITDVTYGEYTLSGTYTEKTDMATTHAYALSNATSTTLPTPARP